MAIVVEKLEKIYKEKGGADVRALKDISFNLPDTGMIFILGKSGCGKSTLLNILGGIDGFDGGDVIIDGKSIKDYGATDLDAYRKAYVGFVFQENNLLDRESVKANVSLALELQSERDNGGKVFSALESVGLKDFADRKCNRLSGGQKQRVAIARALIKSPKLLLCDEPTGALDSETGAEIFNLLKALSKSRLVVVVSHDRESAEKYGDRIIELKDGEIISDSLPTDAEIKTEEKTEKKRKGLRFTRAFKIGAGYVAVRPVRMAICLLICLITFTLVGVADTVYAYDRDRALLYTMDAQDCKCYAFGKADIVENNRLAMNLPKMSYDEAEELCSLLNVERCDYIYGMGLGFGHFSELNGSLDKNDWAENTRIDKYIEAYGSFLTDYGYTLLSGRLPETVTEVALPEFLFNFFKTHGYKDGSKVLNINSYADLLGKTVSIANPVCHQSFTVTGIIDTNFVYEKQAKVLFEGAPVYGSASGADFSNDMYNIRTDAIHASIFVCEGYNEYFLENFNDPYREIVRVIAPYNGSDKQKIENIRVYTTQYGGKPVSEEGGNCYHLVNYAAVIINDADRTFSVIKKYAVYAVALTVVISVLFFSYYVSGTISEKRREIGILRAMGASRGDILKILACEHGIFTVVTLALSTVIAVVCAVLLNAAFFSSAVEAVLIKFGIRQFAVMSAVALSAIIAGIAVPLIKLLKKRPVDVIADRK